MYITYLLGSIFFTSFCKYVKLGSAKKWFFLTISQGNVREKSGKSQGRVREFCFTYLVWTLNMLLNPENCFWNTEFARLRIFPTQMSLFLKHKICLCAPGVRWCCVLPLMELASYGCSHPLLWCLLLNSSIWSTTLLLNCILYFSIFFAFYCFAKHSKQDLSL